MNYRITKLARRSDFARRASGRRNVTLQRVIHHHAIGIEPPAQRPDGPLHAFDPSPRQAVLVTLIVERNKFVTEHAVQVVAVAAVMHIHIRVRSAGTNSEAVETVVSLGPPAI